MSYECTFVTVHFGTLDTNILFTNLVNRVVCCAFEASLSMFEFVFMTGEGTSAVYTNSFGIFFGAVVTSYDIE